MSTSSAPIEASILLLSQSNTSQSTSTWSLKLAYFILKEHTPIYVVQAYSTPPYSSQGMHLHAVSNVNDLTLVGRNTKTNGIGIQGCVEYVGFLYDICHQAESLRSPSAPASSLSQAHNATSLVDDVDSFFIPLDDLDTPTTSETTHTHPTINLDHDATLYHTCSQRHKHALQQHSVRTESNYAHLLPKILLLRLDTFAQSDHTSAGMSCLRVCHGLHSRGLTLGDMGPLIRKYMDLIFICPKAPPMTELHIKQFLGPNAKVQPAHSDILLAYVDENNYLSVPLLKSLEQSMTSSNASTPKNTPSTRSTSTAPINSSSSSSAAPSSTSSAHPNTVHRELQWKGHIKYGNFHIAASVYCNRSCPVSIVDWPEVIELPGQMLRWSIHKDYMRHLFSNYSKINICQWMCAVREEHQATISQFFHKLFDEDALYVVPLRGETHYFVFTLKGLFSKYLQNAQKDTNKPHFISIIIPKEECERIAYHTNRLAQQRYQQQT